MQVKVNLCRDCADKLRAIMKAEGEQAMGRAVGKVLCDRCRAAIPGYEPGRPLETALKGVRRG